MCFSCESEEEIATIQLDASRVVLSPTDDAGEAETQEVMKFVINMFIFTLILFTVDFYLPIFERLPGTCMVAGLFIERLQQAHHH